RPRISVLGTEQVTLARLLISHPKLQKFNLKSQELTRSEDRFKRPKRDQVDNLWKKTLWIMISSSKLHRS
uniref:Uncharacterized protein n=1 Tax=Romanomermis culicivorax TaxID=13658 RepID=A0A915HH67_ROMCU